MSLDLSKWEWPTFDGDPSLIIRITAVHRGRYIAVNIKTELSCELSGRLSHLSESPAELPTTGDYCRISPPYENESGGLSALIEEVLTRRSQLSRVAAGETSREQLIAANVDTAFLITSANADFNLARLNRYILLCHDGGVAPVVVLSKSDLVEDLEPLKEALQSLSLPIVTTSVYKSETLKTLHEYMKPGSTSVFLGSSGVGKSTLLNALLGEEIQETRSIREDDDRGRHTTTARELFQTPEGALIIDTPGMREIHVHGSEESLGMTFHEVEAFAERCRFNNCTHQNEPGCGILGAIESGDLDPKTLAQYQKLQREIEFSNLKKDKALASNRKKKWKKITLQYREKKKLERRN